MPGKAGPERGNLNTSSSAEIFLLPGAFPIPKPSYGEPRRASSSGSPLYNTSSWPGDNPHELSTSQSFDSSHGFPVEGLPRQQPRTPESGLGSTSESYHNYNLLDKASLEKSTDSELWSSRNINVVHSSDTKQSEPPPLPTTPIPGSENTEEKAQPLSGRERLKLIEEELSQETKTADQDTSEIQTAEEEATFTDSEVDEDEESTWTFHNKRDKFERMASKDGGHASSYTEVSENSTSSSSPRTAGSNTFKPSEQTVWVPSDTALSEKKLSGSQQLSTHSLDSRENLASPAGSGTYVNRIKDGTSHHNHTGHTPPALDIHKTSSDEDVSFSTHLDPHHKGPHFEVHKTSSEEDLSIPSVDVMAGANSDVNYTGNIDDGSEVKTSEQNLTEVERNTSDQEISDRKTIMSDENVTGMKVSFSNENVEDLQLKVSDSQNISEIQIQKSDQNEPENGKMIEQEFDNSNDSSVVDDNEGSTVDNEISVSDQSPKDEFAESASIEGFKHSKSDKNELDNGENDILFKENAPKEYGYDEDRDIDVSQVQRTQEELESLVKGTGIVETESARNVEGGKEKAVDEKAHITKEKIPQKPTIKLDSDVKKLDINDLFRKTSKHIDRSRSMNIGSNSLSIDNKTPVYSDNKLKTFIPDKEFIKPNTTDHKDMKESNSDAKPTEHIDRSKSMHMDRNALAVENKTPVYSENNLRTLKPDIEKLFVSPKPTDDKDTKPSHSDLSSAKGILNPTERIDRSKSMHVDRNSLAVENKTPVYSENKLQTFTPDTEKLFATSKPTEENRSKRSDTDVKPTEQIDKSRSMNIYSTSSSIDNKTPGYSETKLETLKPDIQKVVRSPKTTEQRDQKQTDSGASSTKQLSPKHTELIDRSRSMHVDRKSLAIENKTPVYSENKLKTFQPDKENLFIGQKTTHDEDQEQSSFYAKPTENIDRSKSMHIDRNALTIENKAPVYSENKLKTLKPDLEKVLISPKPMEHKQQKQTKSDINSTKMVSKQSMDHKDQNHSDASSTEIVTKQSSATSRTVEHTLSRQSQMSNVSGSGYTASGESDNEIDNSQIGNSYTSIANSSTSELKKINVENSDEDDNFRAISPKDGRYIDPNKMEPNNFHFKRISTAEESSTTEPEENSYRVPRKKRPVSGRSDYAEYMKDIISASDVGHTTENDGDREFSDSDEPLIIADNHVVQDNGQATDEKENLHGILSSVHSLHKKKESKVHFDDSHLYETKYFKSPDVKPGEGGLSSDDSDNVPVVEEVTGVTSRRPNRKSQRMKTKRNEILSPADPKNNASKSTAMMEKVRTANVDEQERMTQRRRSSVPALSDAVVQKMVEELKPLVLEELVTLDGQRETMNVMGTPSSEISRMLAGVIHRAADSVGHMDDQQQTVTPDTQRSDASEIQSSSFQDTQDESSEIVQAVHSPLNNGLTSSSEIEEHVQTIHFPQSFTPSYENIPEIDISEYISSIEDAYIREMHDSDHRQGSAKRTKSKGSSHDKPSLESEEEEIVERQNSLINQIISNEIHTSGSEEAMQALQQNKDFPPQKVEGNGHVESHVSTPHALMHRSAAEKSKSLFTYAMLAKFIQRGETQEELAKSTHKSKGSVPAISTPSKLDTLIQARDALEKAISNESHALLNQASEVLAKSSSKEGEGPGSHESVDTETSDTSKKEQESSEGKLDATSPKRGLFQSIMDILPPVLFMSKSTRRDLDKTDGIERQSSSRLIDKVQRKNIDQAEYEQVSAIKASEKEDSEQVPSTDKETDTHQKGSSDSSDQDKDVKSKEQLTQYTDDQIKQLKQSSMPNSMSPSKLLPKRPQYVDNYNEQYTLQTHSQQDSVKQVELDHHTPSIVDEYESTYNVFDYTSPSALYGMHDTSGKPKLQSDENKIQQVQSTRQQKQSEDQFGKQQIQSLVHGSQRKTQKVPSKTHGLQLETHDMPLKMKELKRKPQQVQAESEDTQPSASANKLPDYQALSEILAQVIDKNGSGTDIASSTDLDLVALSAMLQKRTAQKAQKQQKKPESSTSVSCQQEEGKQRKIQSYVEKGIHRQGHSYVEKGIHRQGQGYVESYELEKEKDMQSQRDQLESAPECVSPRTLEKMVSSVSTQKRDYAMSSRDQLDLGLERASDMLLSKTSVRQKLRQASDEELQKNRLDAMMSWMFLQKANSDQEERIAKHAVAQAVSPTVSFDDRRTAMSYTGTDEPSPQNDAEGTQEIVKGSKSDPSNEYTESSLLDLICEYYNQNPVPAYSNPDLPPEVVKQLISWMTINSPEENVDRDADETHSQRPSVNNNNIITAKKYGTGSRFMETADNNTLPPELQSSSKYSRYHETSDSRASPKEINGNQGSQVYGEKSQDSSSDSMETHVGDSQDDEDGETTSGSYNIKPPSYRRKYSNDDMQPPVYKSKDNLIVLPSDYVRNDGHLQHMGQVTRETPTQYEKVKKMTRDNLFHYNIIDKPTKDVTPHHNKKYESYRDTQQHYEKVPKKARDSQHHYEKEHQVNKYIQPPSASVPVSARATQPYYEQYNEPIDTQCYYEKDHNDTVVPHYEQVSNDTRYFTQQPKYMVDIEYQRVKTTPISSGRASPVYLAGNVETKPLYDSPALLPSVYIEEPYTNTSTFLSQDKKSLSPSDKVIKNVVTLYEQERQKIKEDYFQDSVKSSCQNYDPLNFKETPDHKRQRHDSENLRNQTIRNQSIPICNAGLKTNTDDSYIFGSSTPIPSTADHCDVKTYEYQMTGASLPTSPAPDQTLSTGRRSAMGTADARSFLVEKELIESQLRKLQVENSSLQTENKLLKEKYNRAQTRIQTLESQLLNHRHEADTMHSTLDEITISSRKSRSHNEQEKHDLEEKVLKLTRELENLKAENASLERQLESSRRSSDMYNHSTDKSHIVEGFRAELVAMREELSKVKTLLDQAEKERQSEADRRKEAAAQVVKLTEMKTLLQQQIENSGGSVAEKQVKSLETRLKITEDRFHQERGDRAGKLSEVEEKLLNENSKLQVAEKEMTRQLQREKDKNRNLDNKYKDTKDENERLRVSLGEKPAALQNLPHHVKYSKISPSLASKKPNEMKFILDQLQKEDGLDPDQTEDMVWLLWHRHEQASKMLCLWEGALKELQIDTDNIGAGFKNLREERGLFDDKLQYYKETIEDLSQEKSSLEKTMHKQIHDLVTEKHTSQAQMRNLEDQNAAIQAENQSLRNSLHSSGLGTSTMIRTGEINSWEAQLESLQSELQGTRGDLQQNSRQNKLLEAELISLRAQHQAKEQALGEALDELVKVGSSKQGNLEMEKYKDHKADKLSAQVKSLEVEIQHWQDKHASTTRECNDLETEYAQLQRQMARAKFTTDGRIIDPALESEKLALESELNEKDEQVLHLTVSYKETENELQRTRQLLVLQQQHTDSLGEEMEQLHTEVRQKKLLFDRMTNAETEYHVSMAALRENLDKLNQELAEASHELKLKTVELNHQNAKVQKLEKDLNERDRMLSGNIAQAIQDGSLKSSLLDPAITGDSLTHAETQTRLLQYEVDKNKHQIEKTGSVLENLVKENVDLVTQSRQYQQELVSERAKLCQVACEKSDLEKKLKVLEEETVAVRKDRASLEQDLTKQEVAVANMVERLESEADKAGNEFEQKYRELDKQGKMVAMELATVKRLLEARDRETDLLRDTIERQKQENVSLNRRIQVMREENAQSAQEIDDLTKELTIKMKENAEVAEVSHTLASERAQLQLEKNQLEKDHNKDNTDIERKFIEIQGLQKKLDSAEEKQRSAETQLHQKETQLVAIETELRHLKREITQMENEKVDLKNQNNALNEEIRHVGSMKDTFEQRLNLEKNTLSKEKSDSTHMKESLSQTTAQLELVKREYDILYANLEQQKNTIGTLKNQCQQEEDKNFKLQDDLRAKSLEVETLKRHLEDSKGTLEHCKKDKQNLYQDVQDLCKQLSEKDDAMNRVKEKASDTVESVRHDYTTEKSHILQEKQRLESELYRLREEFEELKDRLRQKENQIDMYMRTNKDLETGIKEKYELENALSNQVGELGDLRRNVTRLEAECARLAESNKNLQLNLDDARQSNTALREECRTLGQSSTQENTVLNRRLAEEKRLRDLETTELREQLNRTSADLHTAQKALSSIQENRDLLANTNKSQEYNMGSLKTQLYEETTARKLAEQRVETLQAQLQEIRDNKMGYEEKTAELQAKHAKIEAELSIEKRKFDQLKLEFNEIQNISFQNEAQAKASQIKLADVESENNNLRNQLETCKQDMAGKNKRLSLEIKQHSENHEKDRNKLMAQAEQLAVDLDKCRTQVAQKNKENLVLQEQVLLLESQLRESTNSMKHVRESLKLEEETRDKLDKRNMELELILAKLRTKDGNDLESFETTKVEVQKMLTELSKRMQDQLDTQKGYDSEARNRDAKRIEELKKRISGLESELSQEQAMHIVSKTQLQSLEDDNQRLRQNIQSLRKRQLHSDNPDRNKNRIEAINEIIAKSQSQAQQMLASGNFNMDTDTNAIPGLRSYNTTQQLPNSQYWMLTSPRGQRSDNNRSLGSEDITLSMLNGPHTASK